VTAIAEALHALYLESDGIADAIAFMDAVTWVLKQPRTLDERFEVLQRPTSITPRVPRIHVLDVRGRP
jgi:hypothetical protein